MRAYANVSERRTEDWVKAACHSSRPLPHSTQTPDRSVVLSLRQPTSLRSTCTKTRRPSEEWRPSLNFGKKGRNRMQSYSLLPLQHRSAFRRSPKHGRQKSLPRASRKVNLRTCMQNEEVIKVEKVLLRKPGENHRRPRLLTREPLAGERFPAETFKAILDKFGKLN